jgi:hypothetical protein
MFDIPFSHHPGSLQACALLVNVFTLFVGIMLIISAELEDTALRAGQQVDPRERNIISAVVFAANLLVIGLPPLHTFVTGPLPSSIITFVVKDLFACDENDELGPMPDRLEELSVTVAQERAGPGAAAAELTMQQLDTSYHSEDTPSAAARMHIEV